MTTELTKAAQQALEALKNVTDYDQINAARRALQAALTTSQPAQAVPMTDEQIDAMTASIFGAGTLDVEEIHAVREVVRTVEAHHGITAQGGEG